MKLKSIKQTVTLSAKPADIYALLMDSKKHGALTGGKATISKKEGGRFTVFDGYAHGYNIELKENKKIVQAWHFAEEGWPDDHFSICTFTFAKAPTGTKLSFIQTDIPEHKAKALAEGWKQYYWTPIKEYLAAIKRAR